MFTFTVEGEVDNPPTRKYLIFNHFLIFFSSSKSQNVPQEYIIVTLIQFTLLCFSGIIAVCFPLLFFIFSLSDKKLHLQRKTLYLIHIEFFHSAPGNLAYQAQSPDEAALVGAARNFGFVFKVGEAQFSLQLKRCSLHVLTHPINPTLLLREHSSLNLKTHQRYDNSKHSIKKFVIHSIVKH